MLKSGYYHLQTFFNDRWILYIQKLRVAYNRWGQFKESWIKFSICLKINFLKCNLIPTLPPPFIKEINMLYEEVTYLEQLLLQLLRNQLIVSCIVEYSCQKCRFLVIKKPLGDFFLLFMFF